MKLIDLMAVLLRLAGVYIIIHVLKESPAIVYQLLEVTNSPKSDTKLLPIYYLGTYIAAMSLISFLLLTRTGIDHIY